MADGAPSLRPDEFSLGARLEKLLDILAGEGLIIGARERTAAHLLFVHEMEAAAGPDVGAAVSPARERELLARTAPVLAPLLARTREEREKFFRVMDTLYPALAAGSTSASAGSQGGSGEPSRTWIRRHWGKLFGLAVLIILGLAAAVLFRPSQKQPELLAPVTSDGSTTEITGAVPEAAVAAQPEERKPQTSDRLLARVMAAAEGHEGAPTLTEIAAQVFDDEESLGISGAASSQDDAQYLSLSVLGAETAGALFSRDGNRILTCSRDKTARLWDTATGKQIGPALTHDNVVNGAVFSTDDSRILTWSQDNTARLWDAATGRPIGPALTHAGGVSGAVFSKDERRILTWSEDKTARLWDAATGKQIGPALTHDSSVRGAVFSKAERRILTWSDDNTARLWDAATGKPIGPALTHDGAVYGAVFSKDDSRILTWSDDKTARLWDAATGKPIGPALTHDSIVFGAVFSKDDSRILTWSVDKTARLWDAATGKQIGPALTHDGSVTGAAFSKDESRILSWEADGLATVWQLRATSSSGVSWSATSYAERLAELTGLPTGRPLPVFGQTQTDDPGLLWGKLAQALGRIEQPGLEPPLETLKLEANKALSDVQRPRAYRVLEQLRTVFPNPAALAGSPTTPALTAGAITAKLIAADADLDDARKIGEGAGEDVARALAMAGYPTVAFHHVPWESQPVRPASTPPPDWLPWVALALPLIAALWLARSLFLMRPYLRRRPPRIPPTHTELVSEAGKRANVDAGYFQRVAQRLRVRTSRPSAEIDIAATIAATLKAGGLIVEPVQARARARPDYLVLVERMAAGDHDALRMQRLIERLSELVDLDIYAFQYDPGEIEPWGGGRRITIEEAQSRHPDHRLIVLGTGSGLLDPLTLEPREAARKLMYWPRRVLLTPMPLAEWGREEYALAEGLAMPVGRATAEGLQFLAELLGLEGSEAEAQPDPRGDGLARPLPDLLRLRPQRFLFNTPPDKATVAQLVTELRNVLTPAEFDWFASLAIYPSVQWDLTLFLGVYLPLRDTDALIIEPATGPAELQKLQAPAEPLYGEGRLAAIAQLPWLRAGKMPNWLRTLLIKELSPKRAAQVRRVLQKALESSRPRDAATKEEEAVFRIAEDRVRNEPRKEALPPEKVFDDDVLLDFLAGAQRGDFSVTRLPRIDGRFLRNFWQQLGGPGGLAGLAALAFGLTGYFVAPRGPGPALTGAYGPLFLLAIGAALAAGFWRPAALGRSMAGFLERIAPGAFALGFATLAPAMLMLTPLAGSLRAALLTQPGAQTDTAGAAWAQAAAGFLALSVLCIAGLLLARWLGERLALRIHAAPLDSPGRWLALLAKGLVLGAIGFGLLRASAGAAPAGFGVAWPVALLLVAALGIPAARFAPEAATLARAAAREERGSRALPVALRLVLTALPLAAAIALALDVSLAHDRRQLLAGEGDNPLAMHPERVAISADGGAIVSADAAGRLVLSRADGTMIAEAKVERPPLTALAIGGVADARQVAFADAEGFVFRLRADGSLSQVMADAKVQLQSVGAPAQLAFGANGALLAAVETARTDGHGITLLNRDGRALETESLIAPPAALTALEAGRWALATLDGQVHVLRAGQGLQDSIETLTWNPDLKDDHPAVRIMTSESTLTGHTELHLVAVDGALLEAVYSGSKWGAVSAFGSSHEMALGPSAIWHERPKNVAHESDAGFIWPVNGELIGRFGVGSDGDRNDGINIKAALGASVRATSSGEVVYSGSELAGFGNLVLVTHPGGWASAYAHLGQAAVNEGDLVTKGQFLGTVGTSGLAPGTDPQLHFEIRKAKVPVDPLTVLPVVPPESPALARTQYTDPYAPSDPLASAPLPPVDLKPSADIRSVIPNIAGQPRSDAPKAARQPPYAGPPYQVAGKWYVPAFEPNYDEVGIAGWYGPTFHGKASASGEIFDQNQFSAAHPTLPIPSLARVTNLENGRSVIVRVNDRGPYVDDRIIDLSKRAGESLGIVSTAKVRVQYFGPAPAEGVPAQDVGPVGMPEIRDATPVLDEARALRPESGGRKGGPLKQARLSISQRQITVGDGETLYDVSRRAIVNMRTLIETNNLMPPYQIEVGQTLLRPESNIHTVAPGETLYSISRAYVVDTRSIAIMNGLKRPWRVWPGDELLLPPLAKKVP